MREIHTAVVQGDEVVYDPHHWNETFANHLQLIHDAEPYLRLALILQIPDLLHVHRVNKAAHKLEAGA